MAKYEYNENYQTQTRGKLEDEYQLYLDFADDGQGGDITNNGAPLKTYFPGWLTQRLLFK